MRALLIGVLLAVCLSAAYAAGVADLVGAQLGSVPRPVTCSNRLVEANVLAAPDKYVITLVNFSNAPVKSLTVRLNAAELGPLTDVRASYGPVKILRRNASGIELQLPRLDKWEVLVVGRK